jgi:hypothetical protein
MDIRWPTITTRLRGRRVIDLRYDSEAGQVAITLEDSQLFINADIDGCHVVVSCNPEPRVKRMSYPIPLGRYDGIRVAALPAGQNVTPNTLVGEKPDRWEIIEVVGSGGGWIVVLGRVRVGLSFSSARLPGTET